MSLRERFMLKIRRDPNGCWIWIAGKMGKGYGVITVNGRSVGAHRISFLLHHGDPGKRFVCHSCDTPACVNPEHLFLGSVRDNSIDALRKGRLRTRLTPADVKEIRARVYLDAMPMDLARYYRVNVGTIYDILHGRTWDL